jgi:Fe-S-cluster containining protein
MSSALKHISNRDRIYLMPKNHQEKWYQSGLAFACTECGNCCSGPEEGYIWINRAEITALAKYLKKPEDQVIKQYLYRAGLRYSIIEKQPGKDCIFLNTDGTGKKTCAIYPVRPLQCRTWPFWKENLRSRLSWAEAQKVCPGIGQSSWHDCSRIEALRDGDLTAPLPAVSAVQMALTWIKNNLRNQPCLSAIQEIYHDIDKSIESVNPSCENCGSCCDFDSFGHRLYVTTLEMLYFFSGLENSPARKPATTATPPTAGRCPYRQPDGCVMREYRPASCRIFYCRDLDVNFQNELTEQVLDRLRRLHEQFNAVYCYADLCKWLKEANFQG